MADTSFVDNLITAANRIVAAWLNVVNKWSYWGRRPNFATTTGAADAQILTLETGSLYVAGEEADGDLFMFKAGFTNTGPATLQVLTPAGTNVARAIQFAGAALVGGEIVAGQNYAVTRLGTTWQLLNFTPNAFILSLLNDPDGEEFLDTLLSAVSQETTPAAGDFFPFHDISVVGAAQGRIATLENLFKVINTLTEQTTPEGAEDYIVIYDADLTAPRKTLLGNAVNGAFRSVQIFTASGTYTPPAGLRRVKVTVVGSGGGSGGCAATGASQSAATAGGGAGGAAIKLIEASALGATEAVTVGAAGAAGAAGNNTGGDGGTSSFGAHATATGGTGSAGSGAVGSTIPLTNGVSGGTGASGDVNIIGGGSTGSFGFTSSAASGAGGASIFGGGGASVTAGASQVGIAGQAYGSGAGGSANGQSQAAVAGAAGKAGIVIVEEFY